MTSHRWTFPAGTVNPLVLIADTERARMVETISEYWERRFKVPARGGATSWHDFLEDGMQQKLPALIILLARHRPELVMRGIGYSAGIRAATPGDIQKNIGPLF